MTTKIASTDGKTALIAGLTWAQLTKKSSERAAEIRSLLADGEASKIITVTSNDHTALGSYTESEPQQEGDQAQVRPRKLHSLAAAFAAVVGNTHAVLAYRLPNSHMTAVIVVESGRPQTDDIKTTEQAQGQAASYASGTTGFTYDLYTNDRETFGGGAYIDAETLWKVTGKRTLLVTKPVNSKGLLLLLLSVVVIVAGGWGYMVYDKAAKKREMIRKAQAENPLPKYRAELAARIGTLGVPPEVIIEVMRKLGTHPLRESGWSLKGIQCTVALNQCVSTWMRDGGTTNTLINARKRFDEEIAGDSTLEESRFIIKMPMAQTGVASRKDLPDATENTQAATPIYQVLANAGLDLKVAATGYQTWPKVAGIDMKALPRAEIVQSRSVEFTTSMPLMAQALLSLPKNYWWTEVNVGIAAGGGVSASNGALGLMNVSVKGNSYVR